jgi:hypothetical protein
MYDIAERTVGIFSAGHDDEIFFTGVDDLHVVESKLVIKRNGNDRLHGALFKNFSDSDICDLHNLLNPPDNGIFCPI